MENNELKPCPVCGRKPKVKYCIIPTGVFCKVMCKPLFRKEHLSVKYGQAGEICDRAEKQAFEEWNRRANDE
jgi:hypothetical protein